MIIPRLSHIISSETDRTEIHFIRQSLSSMIAFSLEYAVLFLLTEKLELHYLISAVAGFMAGNLLLYVLSVRWIYNERRFKDSRFELTLFLFLAGLSLLINTGLFAMMVEIFNIPYLIAKPAGAVLIFFLNFLVKKLWLFRGRRESQI